MIVPSMQPAASNCDPTPGKSVSDVLLNNSCGCAARHQMSPKFPSAVLFDAPVHRSHSVIAVDPPVLKSRSGPFENFCSLVLLSSSTIKSCVHASCSIVVLLLPLRVVSCSHRPFDGFHISMSPLWRPSASRRSEGAFFFELDLWENASAFMGCGGYWTKRQRWISMLCLKSLCYKHWRH